MPGFGPQTISGGNVSQIMVLANLEDADFKPAGLTIDWNTVTAATSLTQYEDGTTLASGQKGIPYGTILTRITASGKFGPWASGASDGRQTLARGACYILNETIVQSKPGSDIPTAVFDGGLVWKDRLRVGGAGQITTANFETAFPRIEYAQD